MVEAGAVFVDGQSNTACGHNLIAVIGVAAAAGLKACLKACNIAGTIKLIGSPGESMAHPLSVITKSHSSRRGSGGKVILLKEGVYDDLDACMMAHPGGGYGPDPFDGTCPIGGPAR